MSNIIPYLVDNAAIIGRVWLMMFLAGFPLNLGLGRYGLPPMSYGVFLRRLTVISAFVATVITGVLVAAAYTLDLI
jgi:hypothetical protein